MKGISHLIFFFICVISTDNEPRSIREAIDSIEGRL
jgi:hypothetical protein